jgi:hypothetical protein
MHVPQTDIILRHGTTELARITLPPGEYIIGRDPKSEIVAHTPLLSRRHARLTIERDRYLLEDLGSSNGTFLNDQPVTGVGQVRPDQSVRLGDVQLEIRRRAPAEPKASPPQPGPVSPPARPAAQHAVPHVARGPGVPMDTPGVAPRKSKLRLYGSIGVGLAALGVAAFFLWPRPEKLTRAQLYALAHPKGQPDEAAPTATPIVENVPARQPAANVEAPVGKPSEQPVPHVPEAATPQKVEVKNGTEKKPTDDAKHGVSPQVAAAKPDAGAAAINGSGDSAEDVAADAKALTEAKRKRLDFIAKFQFAEARVAMMDPALKTEKARDEQELLAKKASWLANFKSQLIEDLNKKGSTVPIARKSGEKMPGGVAQADDQQVTLRSARVPLPWTDLSLDSVYEMGSSFIQPDMAPEITAFRKWHLGVFAFYAGKKKEALELLREAARLRPVFKGELPLFEKATEPY